MTIQQLSQEIGIGIDTLRIWERRYGFPEPARDARGHRTYTSAQVEELRVVKKLQSFGQRPGKIFALSSLQRRELLDSLTKSQLPDNKRMQRLVNEMKPAEIAAELAEQHARLGLDAFIKQYVIPLLQCLDHGWTTGQLSIAREHLVSDQLASFLRRELASSGMSNRPQILFLTLSGERHKIGLLLAALLFKQAGVHVQWVEEELPLSEVPDLAAALGVSAVALSFSSHYASRQAKQDLRELYKNLDQGIKIIAGGCAVQQMSTLPDFLICTDLEQIPELAKRYFSQASHREGES